MSKKVAELLERGGEADYLRLLMLKYGMLQDLVSGWDAALGEELQEQLAPFRELSLGEVVTGGTPFLWNNLQHLYFRIRDNHTEHFAEPPVLVRFFVLSAFDAFFHRLPDGAEVKVRAVEDSTLHLPRLGLLVPGAGKAVTLRRKDARHLEVGLGSGTEPMRTIDLDAPDPEVRIRRLPIPGYDNSQLLMARDPSLFQKEFIDKIEPDPDTAQGLSEMIGQSLDLISSYDAPRAERMIELIHWYVPIETPNLQTHNSFSAPHMIGMIFLSEAYGGLRLAEAMVHEYHHNELYMLMHGTELLRDGGDSRWYSPWRSDPRPLSGLIHALHVFSEIMDFYAAAEKAETREDRLRFFRGRRVEIGKKVEFGLLQVREELLTESGQEVLADLRQQFEEHDEALGVRSRDLNEEMRRHLQTWKQENPQFVPDLRML